MKISVLQPNLKLYFSKKYNKLFLRFNNFVMFLYLPSYYFFNKTANSFNLLFINKYLYKTFLNQLILFSKTPNKIYFFKLRLRGLGYRIRKMSNFLYRFYFACTNYFYFHVPNEIIFFFKKRRILFVGRDLVKLKVIFVHFLFLKKLIPYRIRVYCILSR